MTKLGIAALAATLWFPNAAYAQVSNPADARDADTLLIAPCTGCHTATSPLAGVYDHPPDELLALLRALKTGERSSTLMARLLSGYSDADLVRLSNALSTLAAPSETPADHAN